MRHERVTRAYFTWNAPPLEVGAALRLQEQKKKKKHVREPLCEDPCAVCVCVCVNVRLPAVNLIIGKL